MRGQTILWQGAARSIATTIFVAELLQKCSGSKLFERRLCKMQRNQNFWENALQNAAGRKLLREDAAKCISSKTFCERPLQCVFRLKFFERRRCKLQRTENFWFQSTSPANCLRAKWFWCAAKCSASKTFGERLLQRAFSAKTFCNKPLQIAMG